MTVLGRVLWLLVFWLGVGAAVVAVAVACLATMLLHRVRPLVAGRPRVTTRGAHPIMR